MKYELTIQSNQTNTDDERYIFKEQFKDNLHKF